MKIFLVFVGALFTSFQVSDVETASIERFVTLYRNDDGTPEIIDTQAPLPTTFASASDVTLYLYTKSQPTTPTVLPLNAQTVAASSAFDSSKKNIFIIHGWTNNYESDVNTGIRNAYLSVADVNVFVVDWSSKAQLTYIMSVSNIGSIGEHLGKFLAELQSDLNLDWSKFMLAGHSLGAHVAGAAGAATNGRVPVIVGMDPAGPLFFDSIPNDRLDPTDAGFVHVIHTNGGTLGYNNDLGTVDFRPNGGSSQPGCGVDLVGTCAHSRSHQYFAESITTGGFVAHACDSYRNFNKNRCSSSAQATLGGVTIDTSVSGDYYLNTGSSSPFALF